MGEPVYGTGYLKSSQGIIKIIQSVVCLIGLVIIVSDGWSSDLLNAYTVGTAVGLTLSIIFLILYTTKAARPFHAFLAFQLYFNVIWFIYLLIVSAVLISKKYGDKYTAGGSFGIIAAILYLIDAVDCYRVDPSPVLILFIRS